MNRFSAFSEDDSSDFTGLIREHADTWTIYFTKALASVYLDLF